MSTPRKVIPIIPPAPPCFDSTAQWRAWLDVARTSDGKPGPAGYCADCTQRYQAEMTAAGRCRYPDATFTENKGTRVHQKRDLPVGLYLKEQRGKKIWVYQYQGKDGKIFKHIGEVSKEEALAVYDRLVAERRGPVVMKLDGEIVVQRQGRYSHLIAVASDELGFNAEIR